MIDGTRRWVVYKTPNSGVTSKNSSNTRTELHEKREWTPEEGGKLTGTCKVMQVSISGDARVAASYSTVVGQIHSGEGHENEPLKIFYKKFPGHTKVLSFGIMKSIQKVMTIPEGGNIPMLFGGTICLSLEKVKTTIPLSQKME